MSRKQEPLVLDSKPNPKLRTGVLFLAIILISFAAFVYAHDPQYNEQNYSFRAGYTAGYGHGNADQRARTSFDFRHDREYQRGAPDQQHNVFRQDLNFRLGYVEGYADGYFRRNPLFGLHQQDASYGNYDQNYGSLDQGAIMVFTSTNYRGYAREFGIGQYPSLEGRLDDDIQSVRVSGNLRLVLFEHDKFKGKSIVVERNASDLGSFKRKAGSMIVEPIRYGQLR